MKKEVVFKILMGVILTGLISSSFSMYGMLKSVAQPGRQALRQAQPLWSPLFPSIFSPNMQNRSFSTQSNDLRSDANKRLTSRYGGGGVAPVPQAQEDTSKISELFYLPSKNLGQRKKDTPVSKRVEVEGDESAIVEELSQVASDANTLFTIDPSVLDAMYHLQKRISPEFYQFFQRNAAIFAPLVLKIRGGALQPFEHEVEVAVPQPSKDQPRREQAEIINIDSQGEKPLFIKVDSQQSAQMGHIADIIESGLRQPRQLLQATATSRPGRPTNQERGIRELRQESFNKALLHSDNLIANQTTTLVNPQLRLSTQELWRTVRARLVKEGQQKGLVPKPMGPKNLRKSAQKKGNDFQVPQAPHVPEPRGVQPIRGEVPMLPEYTEHAGSIKQPVIPQQEQIKFIPDLKKISIKSDTSDVVEQSKEGQLKGLPASDVATLEIRNTDVPDAYISRVGELSMPISTQEGTVRMLPPSGTVYAQPASVPHLGNIVQEGVLPEHSVIHGFTRQSVEESLTRSKTEVVPTHNALVIRKAVAQEPVSLSGTLRTNNKALTAQALWPSWKPGPNRRVAIERNVAEQSQEDRLRLVQKRLQVPATFNIVYPGTLPVVPKPSGPVDIAVLEGTILPKQGDEPAVSENVDKGEDEGASEHDSKEKAELEHKEQEEKKEREARHSNSKQQGQQGVAKKPSSWWRIPWWRKFPSLPDPVPAPLPSGVAKKSLPWWRIPWWKKFPSLPNPIPAPLPNRDLGKARSVPPVLAPISNNSLSPLPVTKAKQRQEEWKKVALEYKELAAEVLKALQKDIIVAQHAFASGSPIPQSEVVKLSFAHVKYTQVRNKLERRQAQYKDLWERCSNSTGLTAVTNEGKELAHDLDTLAKETFYLKERVTPKNTEAMQAAQ